MKRENRSTTGIYILGIICLMMSNFTANKLYATATIKDLRVEYMRNPIGIDVEMPRFSWRMEADERGVSQSAYEIIVSTDEEASNVIWNSGKVENEKSIHIIYNGNALQPSTRYYWKVSVWDNADVKTTSTEKAFFETGLKDAGWGDAKWLKVTKKAQGESGGDNEIDLQNITKYTVEMDFKVVAVAAGPIFGAKDNNNFFMWQINTEKGGVGSGKTYFRPHSWKGGGAASHEGVNGIGIDITSIVGNVENGQFHKLRIEVDEDKATTYIDDKVISLDYVNPRGGNYGFGKVGFRADVGDNDKGSRPEESFFDNIKVTAYDGSGNPVVLFTEGFEDSNNYGFVGALPVESGQLHVTGRSGSVYYWQKEAVAASYDYTLEMDVTLIKDNAGIIFSAANQSYFLMWGINTFDKSVPILRRHFYSGGGPSYDDIDITAFNKAYLLNTERKLKIEVKGNVIKTYIGPYLVDSYEDNSGLLCLGDIGFRAHKGNSDEIAYYDNVVLTDYSTGEAVVVLSEDFEGEDNILGSSDLIEVAGSKKLNMFSTNGEKRAFNSTFNGIDLFRTEFTLGKTIKSATLYSSGLGVYDVFINGQRVGTPTEGGGFIYDELKPGWTDYSKTIFYMTYDVTSLLKQGANAIGAQVSSGWWAGKIAYGEYGNPELGFIAKMVVEYTDGTSETISTKTSTWLSAKESAVRFGEIYDGEVYDARLESDWTNPGFDDSGWYQTGINTDFTGKIKAFVGPTVRVRPELERTPISIVKYEGTRATGSTFGMINEKETHTGSTAVTLKKGETLVYDLGQNMVGWVRFKVKGNAGTKLTFRFAEMLNDTGASSRGDDGPGGSLYTIALRGAKAMLYYTLKGDPEGEEFNPSTTFFGFRYCDIIATGDVEIEYLKGDVVGTVSEEGSSFTTSHSAVNQLYQNVMWGQRGNFLSIPTDCPQRDERLGWTGDIQVFGRAATYNADIAAFFHKWMGDMRDSQRSDGAYPDVAPHAWVGYGQSAWAEAGLVAPWITYLMYDNIGILEENFESMEKYMTFLSNQKFDGYLYNGAGTNYGDWVAPEGLDGRYVSVCYYAYAALLMEKISKAMSKVAGDTYDVKAASYQTLYKNIKAEFQSRYVRNGATLNPSTQTAYLLALKLELYPTEIVKENWIRNLNTKITNNGNRLSTGFVGTGIINQTLSDIGSTNTAYNLLLQRNNPSWLYSVDQGATTIWERWNGYTKESGFHSDITMNSFNHYANGAVSEWMYRYMAGINADEAKPGFKHIILSPEPDFRKTRPAGQERITSVNATYNSYYGDIKSTWKVIDEENMAYEMTIPANTTATVILPLFTEADEIVEGTIPVAEAEGIISSSVQGNKIIMEVVSGTYKFKVTKGEAQGIEIPKSNKQVTVYPNPASDVLYISSSEDIQNVQLFDAIGAILYSQKGGDPIKLNSFTDGIYFVKVSIGNQVDVVSFIKK